MVCINQKNLDLNHSSMQTIYLNEASKRRIQSFFLKIYIKSSTLIKKDVSYPACKLHMQKYFQDKNIKAMQNQSNLSRNMNQWF